MRAHSFGALCSICIVLAPVADSRAGVDVAVSGLDGPLRRNVELSLSIRRARDELSAGQIQRLHERASEEIASALQPFGYYSPLIEAQLEPDGKNWKVRYRIDPGQVVRVDRLDTRLIGDGAEDPEFVELVESFPLAEGDVLEHAAYTLGKGRLALYAARHGYLDAAFDSSVVRVHVEKGRAEVVLHMNTGPRYRFGEVNLYQDVLDDEMVRGYALAKPGEPYDVDLLLKMHDDLGSTPYFRDVEIDPRRKDAGEDLCVPIDVTLRPARTQRYELGAGYGTDTGVRGKVSSSWRRLNRRGHHAEAMVQGSKIEFSASARYMIPWPYPRTEEFAFYGGIGRFDPDWYTSWRSVAGVGLDRTSGGWNQSYTLAYEHESFTVAEADGSSNLIIPGIAWSHVRADDRLFPTRGSRLGVELKGSSRALASSTDFAKLDIDTKWIRRPFAPSRIIVRATVGRIWPSNFDELPPSHRFVTGGDQTVRGFDYQSLGPANPEGDLVGGNSLLLGSLEFELLARDPWGLAVFADAGNALNGFSGSIESAAGGGLRWRSPIGMIRLDLAWALSQNRDPKLHLSIGPDL